MKPPRCTVFPPSTRYRTKVVRSVRFDGESLVFEVQGDGFSFARVTFERVIGFRALHERDLCEFWPTYSDPAGWLFEVHEGGWSELEQHRPLFNSHEVFAGMREFFLTDHTKCFSIFSVIPPDILDLGCDPQTPNKAPEPTP